MAKQENIVTVRRANAKLADKFKDYIKPREEFVEFNVRGAKAQKLAEIAEVIKYISRTDASKSFQIPREDFEKAYGVGKKGISYVKRYMKRFGVPAIRVAAAQDTVHMWSRTEVKE